MFLFQKGTEEVEEAATSKEVVNERKTFASEEQIRAVLSNRLVSLQYIINN